MTNGSARSNPKPGGGIKQQSADQGARRPTAGASFQVLRSQHNGGFHVTFAYRRELRLFFERVGDCRDPTLANLARMWLHWIDQR